MLNSIHGSDLIVISSHEFGSTEVRTSELMNLMCQNRRVFFINRPVFGITEIPTFYYNKESHKVIVVQPYLPENISIFFREDAMIKLIDDLIHDEKITHLTIWTDTPKGMPFIRRLDPEVSVYDKMDEVELQEHVDILLDKNTATETIRLEIEIINTDNLKHIYLTEPTEVIVNERSHPHPPVESKKSLINHYKIFED
jgi:hypothetical protein